MTNIAYLTSSPFPVRFSVFAIPGIEDDMVAYGNLVTPSLNWPRRTRFSTVINSKQSKNPFEVYFAHPAPKISREAANHN